MRSICWCGRALVGCILLLLLAPVMAQTMRVHFIDVGQGAATLVEFPCAAMLIDTGGEKNSQFDSNAALVAYLDDFFAGRPDLHQTLKLLVLTHPHIDHTRGVAQVLARYRVQNALTDGLMGGSGRYGQTALLNKVRTTEETPDPDDDIAYTPVWQYAIPSAGLRNAVIDPIDCGTVDPVITALWGQVRPEDVHWTQEALKNENNHSVVLRIDFGVASVLLSGDLEVEGIEELVKRYHGTGMLDVDVVQVNHHGAANGTTPPLLGATTPQYAVIAMGAPDRELGNTAWDYGHPRKPTLEYLQANVSRTRPRMEVMAGTGKKSFEPFMLTKAVYGTGWDGTVVLETDMQGHWVSLGQASAPGLLDLNTASLDSLVTLPMIGTARAQAIMRYREEHGPIGTVDELLNIRGIKAGTVEAIRPLVQQQ